jgi:hypothetical protein
MASVYSLYAMIYRLVTTAAKHCGCTRTQGPVACLVTRSDQQQSDLQLGAAANAAGTLNWSLVSYRGLGVRLAL